ncbi:MAG: DM13 domain-containing protein [Rubrivivax sp.]
MKKPLLLIASHALVLGLGFALGIYALPILTAPTAASAAEITQQVGPVLWRTEFRRDLKDSDALHWGEGRVLVGARSIGLLGRLAPGPDYKLYLSPAFVETEQDFLRLKAGMLRAGDVKTFENFLVPLPEGVDPARYTSVIVWCESFGQFITAARYR